MRNLVLLCAAHHTQVHEHGYQLVLSPDRTLTVRTAGDIPVPHHPSRPDAPAADTPVEPYACGWQGDRFDLDYIVSVLAPQTG